MVALRGAESARFLKSSGLIVRAVLLLAVSLGCVVAFQSAVRKTGGMSERLTPIELVGYFLLRAGSPAVIGLAAGFGVWQSLQSLLGGRSLREAVRLVATSEGVWVSSDSDEYPKERRPWSSLKEVRVEARGRLVLVQAIRTSTDSPVDLLWRRAATAEEANEEAARLNPLFAALQRLAQPEPATDAARPPHTP